MSVRSELICFRLLPLVYASLPACQESENDLLHIHCTGDLPKENKSEVAEPSALSLATGTRSFRPRLHQQLLAHLQSNLVLKNRNHHLADLLRGSGKGSTAGIRCFLDHPIRAKVAGLLLDVPANRRNDIAVLFHSLLLDHDILGTRLLHLLQLPQGKQLQLGLAVGAVGEEQAIGARSHIWITQPFSGGKE